MLNQRLTLTGFPTTEGERCNKRLPLLPLWPFLRLPHTRHVALPRPEGCRLSAEDSEPTIKRSCRKPFFGSVRGRDFLTAILHFGSVTEEVTLRVNRLGHSGSSLHPLPRKFASVESLTVSVSTMEFVTSHRDGSRFFAPIVSG